MPKASWTDSELDVFAGHVDYEVRMWVGQVGYLLQEYGRELPPGFTGPTEDAVLEASLMHLRLLDDFLRNWGDHRAIKGEFWVPGWEAETWLDESDRKRINAKVVHLSRLRNDSTWDLYALGSACCEQLSRFFTQVQKRCDPDRLAAFLDAPEDVRRGFNSS
jgi:hypothetical protein